MKKDFFYVLIQFVLFALYFIDWNILELSLPRNLRLSILVLTAIGVLVILFGILNLNQNLSPFPTPKKNASLISNGIYNYVRHPIYSGLILSMVSYAMYSESVFRLIIALTLLVVFYFKSDLEEKLLMERFSYYKEYRKTTGRFCPKFNRNS